MPKNYVIRFLILLSLLAMLRVGPQSQAATTLSRKPILYSRVNTDIRSKDITKRVKKNANKLHKSIMKCKKKAFKKTYTSLKQCKAETAYMFGKYLNYIRAFDLEGVLDYTIDKDVITLKGGNGIYYNKKTKKATLKIPVKKYKTLRKRNNYIRKSVKGALSRELQFPLGCSESAAIDTISNWICAKVEYDYSALGRHNIYYAFRDRLILCMGYADTFQVIANEVGISTWIVGSTDHEFNRVLYDRSLRYVDVCWADGGEGFFYNHLTPEQLATLQHHKVVDIEEFKNIKIDKRDFKTN